MILERRIIKMYNLENCPLSDKNGAYGGHAGLKEGIIFDNKYWLVKYQNLQKAWQE